MKVIGLKPDSFEPRPVVDTNNLYAAKGVQPVQTTSHSQLDTHITDSSKHLLDFMEKLKQKKNKGFNKKIFDKGKRAYIALLNIDTMLSQIGAKLDKRI